MINVYMGIFTAKFMPENQQPQMMYPPPQNIPVQGVPAAAAAPETGNKGA
jgi:hypothetical protein